MATAMTLAFLATLALPPPAAGEEVAVTAPAAGAANQATAPDEKAFVPPDGWRPKKRGEFTVYCRKESVMGTRVPAEVCYDENGIRAMMQELRENREKVDQLRRICSSQAACGSH